MVMNTGRSVVDQKCGLAVTFLLPLEHPVVYLTFENPYI